MDKQKQAELLRVVENNYETIAEDFNTTRKKVLWPTLFELAAEVKDGDSVLDVGCGNGRLLKAFEGKKIKYLGIDQSSGLINLARKNSTEFANSIDVDFVIGNMLDLEKKVKGEFDWIYSHAVIHHLPSHELRLQAMRAMRNKLKQNGKIVISVWRPWTDKKLRKILFLTILRKFIFLHPYDWNDLVFKWKNNQSLRYYHFFTKGELKKLMKQSGLEIVEIRSEPRNYYLVLK